MGKEGTCTLVWDGTGTCTLVWDSAGTCPPVYDTMEFGGSVGTLDGTDAGFLDGTDAGPYDKMAIFSHPEHRHASTRIKRME